MRGHAQALIDINSMSFNMERKFILLGLVVWILNSRFENKAQKELENIVMYIRI